MAKKIILKLTQAQFTALISLAEEMAITLAMSDEETSRTTKRRMNLVNKALRENNIDYKLRA